MDEQICRKVPRFVKLSLSFRIRVAAWILPGEPLKVRHGQIQLIISTPSLSDKVVDDYQCFTKGSPKTGVRASLDYFVIY